MIPTEKWFVADQEVILRDWALEVPAEDILRLQAADAAVVLQRNPALVNAAKQAGDLGSPHLEPAVLYKVLRVDGLLHERLILSQGYEMKSTLLAEHLKSATYVVVALCTIGSGVEKLAKETFKTDPVLGLGLEGFGSAAVETLATEFCAHIDEKAAGAGMAATIPLSPGMIGWSVEEGQKQIFGILDSRAIGVQLTTSLMMMPVKTISLILGVGENLEFHGSTCDLCNMRDRCHYRDHYLHDERS